MTAEFYIHAADVVNLLQRGQYGSEVNFTLSKKSMFVDATLHVFDVDIAKPVFPTTKMIGDRA